MTQPTPPERQPAYDAVYAVIHEWPALIDAPRENARIWRAVEAALDAMQAAGRLLPAEATHKLREMAGALNRMQAKQPNPYYVGFGDGILDALGEAPGYLGQPITFVEAAEVKP